MPDNYKSGEAPAKKRVTIYFSTLFQIDRFNIANIFETALCPAVADGKLDYFILIKAEGLNALAYKRSDGVPVGEEKVAVLVGEKLLEIFRENNIGKDDALVDVVAYSEGAPQAVAAAYKLKSDGYNVRQFVGVCGAGIIGVENQRSAHPIIHTFTTIIKMFKNRKITLSESVYDLTSLVAPLYEGEDDRAWGEWNVNFWIKRLVFTQLGLEKIMRVDGVPMERLKVAVTKSPYYKKLAELQVPMIFFSAKHDVFFDNNKIHKAIRELKDINPKVIDINSNVFHWFAHEHPSMIARAIETAKAKEGWKF
jgi:hypothetical protein